MATDDNEFEDTLKELILAAYADGKIVEGEWRLTTEPDEIPDWTVTVERAAVTAEFDSSDAGRRLAN